VPGRLPPDIVITGPDLTSSTTAEQRHRSAIVATNHQRRLAKISTVLGTAFLSAGRGWWRSSVASDVWCEQHGLSRDMSTVKLVVFGHLYFVKFSVTFNQKTTVTTLIVIILFSVILSTTYR